MKYAVYTLLNLHFVRLNFLKVSMESVYSENIGL